MKIAVLHDFVPPSAREDQLDTLVQVRAICGALTELGHDASELDFTANLSDARDELARRRPDLVFNLVESIDGHSQLLHLAPALLDLLRLPYTGGSTEALFLTTNKLVTKRWLKANDLPTPPWWSKQDGLMGGPVQFPADFILKGICEEASIGIDDASVVQATQPDSLDQLAARRDDQVGGEAFAELYIAGREFNVSVLEDEGGPTVLPPAEIQFTNYPAGKPQIVNYAAKWIDNSFEYHHTPRSFEFPDAERPLLERLNDLARKCWRLFGLRGYARVDFRVDHRGQPWILEINANPCISPDSGFVAAADRAGVGYRDLIHRIVCAAGVRVAAGCA